MELLDVTLTPLQRRNRAAFVRQSDLAGNPVCEPGQRVVLRDEHGEFFSGTIIDADDSTGELRYMVHVGVRLPEEFAMMRLGRDARAAARDAEQREGDAVQAMLDMLGEAREALGGVMPSQRLAY